ncbi:Dopamine beta-hydroxylase-like protein [Leptotrombidium deliense]|uniref:Dopamine beta-hydroxylase-like protein n=1 Tax=Leptotrombidium deliense TaxID=299467 RepID=A0A443SJN0_9ACAR|nr:Dopamine beta-hydroxylase-like protein [Leptotrombidium deliense]
MNIFVFSLLFLLYFNSNYLLLCSNLYKSNATNMTFFQTALDTDDKIHMFWSIDYKAELVTIELRLNVPDDKLWFAVGFSAYGQITNADLCILWMDKKLNTHFDDISTDDDGFVTEDNHNDCQLMKLKRKGSVTRFVFQRKFDTCEPGDYVIEDGTNCIVYAIGSGTLNHIYGLRLNKYNHGFQRVHLLKTLTPEVTFPDDTRVLDIVHDKVHVPNTDTTYWCKLHLLPAELVRKQHIIQYEAVIQPGSEGLVHHMEVFHCEVAAEITLPDWDGSCFDKTMPDILHNCKRVLAAWALGAGPFSYPEVAGLPFGGHNYSRYVMLEVHYNNPDLKAGVIDSSGVRLYYTSTLRKYDVGILEIGLEYTDKNSIPPKQAAFALSGYCVSECSRAGLPPDGITIFASQLHTHLTGIRVYTRHVREGKELDELNRDNYYSTHFQEIRILKRPVHFVPGDALINVCEYDTQLRENITLGGYGIKDEMCVNYMHYYPKTTLEVCKSSVDSQVLSNYFEYMNKYEGQATSKNKSVSENYLSIKWTPYTTKFLHTLYNRAPLSMQCNQSSGERFPGFWNGIPPTPIYEPLKPKERNCNSVL